MLQLDIDNLVRNILADLTVEPVAVRSESIQTDDGIFIDSRVVSLADIKSRLGDAKKLLIAPKSILTPSAKDEIRKRKIEVAVKLTNLAVDRRSPLWFATQHPATFPTKISKRHNVKPKSFETVAAIVENAIIHLSNNNRGVAMSRQSATLLCEANRHKEIRAIYGFDPKQTADDTAELDANLLVLHPDRIPPAKLSDIIKSFHPLAF